MTLSSKVEIAAAYHLANSQNVRLRAEVETLRSKIRSVESLLEEKERRLILLTELLHRRGLPEPQPQRIEAGGSQ